MINLPSNARFYISKNSVDLRRGFDGLKEVVDKFFPYENKIGSFFVFINQRGNKVKILYWDADGVVIWHKRLDPGKVFKNIQGKEIIDEKEFSIMLESKEHDKPI